MLSLSATYRSQVLWSCGYTSVARRQLRRSLPYASTADPRLAAHLDELLATPTGATVPASIRPAADAARGRSR
ncbi:hypothetical protein C8E97_4071 [Saccharothrix australiensis]|uniref:Uncharacterized protein n=1 Tax=Saccharothrix australiensis TaxID=2072 RepID=A0A495W413_9PSEU|nr:hypothetical protein C8E97_4071 [Saccharothrix australiensis]